MIRPPDKAEWDTSVVSAKRRDYLDEGLSFDEIAARVIETATVFNCSIKPYSDAPYREKDGRQIIFVVRVAPQTCDLLYDAPDGLRGRYWQSPDHGFAATKLLIDHLTPTLMAFAARHPPTGPGKHPMSTDDIRSSLEAVTAKIWPRERDDNGNLSLVERDDHVMVRRWKENEVRAEINRGFWRRSPTTGDLEIKGAIIGADKTEYIPAGKRDRSCQIHAFGFT
ncbi:hypothetical protein [Bradyrhizobium sp. USDA 313]|uniref:hypothetical protein n=1 Tax=Bradyrhizobium sp. USDA 313 TaxID=3156307 RepID=UPI003518CD08